MALHGVVVKKNGTVLPIVIGEDADDPVVGISDLLIHLSGKQMEKNAKEVVEGENLNVLVGSIPLEGTETEAVKAQILSILKEKYQVEEEDFISAELEVVPAGAARDFGLDRSMLMAYGHDDRVCAYPSFQAIAAVDKVKYTSVPSGGQRGDWQCGCRRYAVTLLREYSGRGYECLRTVQ